MRITVLGFLFADDPGTLIQLRFSRCFLQQRSRFESRQRVFARFSHPQTKRPTSKRVRSGAVDCLERARSLRHGS